jgi:glycosyltransferase involved in cell wall biosynthesis
MADSTLTTVVVITHNYGRFLRQSVDSVVQQSARPAIIVVDDASTDDTAAVIANLVADYPFVRHYTLATSQGLAQVRNVAAGLVTTDWIVFLDADDWLDPFFIEHGEAWLGTHTDVDVLTTDMRIVRDGHGERVVRSRVPRWWNELLARNTIVQTSFIRRQLIDRVGGYDPSLAFEDWDFWLRVLQRGGRIARLPGAYVFWREHGQNKSKTCDERAAADAIREKHAPPGGRGGRSSDWPVR